MLTHRDPLRVLPSLVSLMATLRWMHSDTVDIDAVVKAAVHGTTLAMDFVMQWRDDGTLPEERIIDVRFDDSWVIPGRRCVRCTTGSGRRSRPKPSAGSAST